MFIQQSFNRRMLRGEEVEFCLPALTSTFVLPLPSIPPNELMINFSWNARGRSVGRARRCRVSGEGGNVASFLPLSPRSCDLC